MYHLQCFGGVSVHSDSGKPIRLRSRKHLALLLYLAVNGRRSHARSRLASLLWSSDSERARHSLSQALYDLRHKLGGAIPSGDGDQIRIDSSQLSCAAVEMEDAVKRGDLMRAVTLYKGPFGSTLDRIGTPDYDYWVESERQRLDRLAQLALRRHVQEADEAARWGEMCVTAVKLLDMNPLDEEAHRALMRGLWLHGDRGSALRHYEQIAASLEKELGGVSPETAALASRIRAGAGGVHFARPGADDAVPLIGRVKEFAVLRTLLDGVQDHGCRSLAVRGTPGIGKTRLVAEFKKCASLHAVTLLESQCYPAEAHIPYGPVIDAMRPLIGAVLAREPEAAKRYSLLPQLFPELAPYAAENQLSHVDPGAWQRRLYEEVADFLRRRTDAQPIVWVVEDVHWIDATSASLLHYVTRRLADQPFVLVQTTRALTKPDFDRPEVLMPTSFAQSSITLPPLQPVDIKELLVRHRPDAAGHPAVELAQRLSGGNPFYALEVLRACIDSTEWASEASDWDPLTDGRLSNVLATRFRGISQTGIRILEAVAVLERHSRPAQLTEVAGSSLHEAALLSSELYTKGLLRDVGDHVEFTHDLTREYLYAQLSALQRAALHSAAANVLERSGIASEATLAGHFHLCGDRPKTFEYAMRAAAEATAAGGHSEATSMATLALESAANLRERLQALTALAQAELLSAQLESARTHYQQILDQDETLTAEQRIEIQLRIVEALAAGSDWVEVDATLSGTYALIRGVCNRQTRCEYHFELLTWRLRAATRDNDIVTSSKITNRIVRLRNATERVGALTDVAAVRALSSLAAFAAFYRSADDALQFLAACDAFEGPLPTDLQLTIRLLKGVANIRMARWDQAGVDLQKALELAKEENDVLQMTLSLNNLACSAVECGDWDRAHALLKKAKVLMRTCELAIDRTIPLDLHSANAAFYIGNAREAQALYRNLLTVVRNRDLTEFRAELESSLGLVALQTGDSEVVSECWRYAQVLCAEDLGGIQERFKVEWFTAYMLRNTSPRGDIATRMLEVAATQAPFDLISSLKLQWLSVLLFPNHCRALGLDKCDLQDQLKRARLGWFCHFTTRWLRTANCATVDA